MKARLFWRALASGLLLLVCAWAWNRLTAAPIKPDEQIVFLPALGHQTTHGWEISVSGFVYEQETRPGVRLVLRKYLGLDDETWSDDQRRIFRERTRPFLIDAESRKTVRVRIGDLEQALAPTDGDGAFGGTLLLPATSDRGQPLAVEVVLPAGDQRHFAAPVRLVPQRGLSVVSDIDDTIKITSARDHRELLLNTFARPFVAVTNMAKLYQSWRSQDAAEFHYLSAGPWQLYPALDGFLRTNGFPEGTVALRAIRIREELFGSGASEEYKLTELRQLLAQFPERDFILVGDSGEKDPEIYGTIFREFPGRIRRIFIRGVTGDAPKSLRYSEAFRDVPVDRWQLFTDPTRLDHH
jgi:phosphatidate phosphatase APP1